MTKSQLLENAVDLLLYTYGQDNLFCTTLIDANDKEEKICEKCEGDLKESCVLRYLKYYKKGSEK